MFGMNSFLRFDVPLRVDLSRKTLRENECPLDCILSSGQHFLQPIGRHLISCGCQGTSQRDLLRYNQKVRLGRYTCRWPTSTPSPAPLVWRTVLDIQQFTKILRHGGDCSLFISSFLRFASACLVIAHPKCERQVV